jgi:predicted RNase H-like nuclease (RuvC/YqgF family)
MSAAKFEEMVKEIYTGARRDLEQEYELKISKLKAKVQKLQESNSSLEGKCLKLEREQETGVREREAVSIEDIRKRMRG